MKCPACSKEIEIIKEHDREVAYCDCGGHTRAVWEYTPLPAEVKKTVKKDGEK